MLAKSNPCDEAQALPRRLSSREAADYLGFAEPTLRNSRLSGTLAGVPAPAFIKIGAKTVRYRRGALDAWLAQFAERTASAAPSAEGGAHA